MRKLVAGLIMAGLAAAPANAVSNVASVRITNALNTWTQVGELLAFETGTGTNVALTGVATADSSYDASSLPDNAIDGDLNTSYSAAPGIFHTGNPNGGFLLVTFAAPVNLASLTIYGRSDCCSERDFFNYELLSATGASLASGQLDARGASHSASVTFAGGGAVPEPATWGLMVLGFGLVGAAMRRRGKTALAAA